MIITLKKPRTEEKFFILIKYIYTMKERKKKNPIANTILNCEILNPFLPRWVRGEAKISALNLYSN